MILHTVESCGGAPIRFSPKGVLCDTLRAKPTKDVSEKHRDPVCYYAMAFQTGTHYHTQGGCSDRPFEQDPFCSGGFDFLVKAEPQRWCLFVTFDAMDSQKRNPPVRTGTVVAIMCVLLAHVACGWLWPKNRAVLCCACCRGYLGSPKRFVLIV